MNSKLSLTKKNEKKNEKENEKKNEKKNEKNEVDLIINLKFSIENEMLIWSLSSKLSN